MTNVRVMDFTVKTKGIEIVKSVPGHKKLFILILLFKFLLSLLHSNIQLYGVDYTSLL